MTVRFVELPRVDEDPRTQVLVDVAYAATASGAPAVGDRVGSDGTDPLFPEGDWDVVGRQWVYGLRGLETIYCEIRRAP
jgi:hypothetical protein